MKNVYLTSFRLSHSLPPAVIPYSAAVYQPKGYKYPKVLWTDIRREDGSWTRPRDFLNFEDPLVAYRRELLDLYNSRLEAAKEWVETTPHDCALCCWCPYDQAAQHQLQEFGSFVCHTAVLGEFLFDKLGVAVWEDGDRRRMAVLTQR